MLILFYFYTLGFAVDTSLVNDKVILKNSNSYHFSKPDLVELHLEGQPKFFIGLKEGSLKYRVGNETINHFILNKDQNRFFQKTKKLISGSLLDWDMKGKKLVISGNSTSDLLFQYLFEECKKSNSSILLDVQNPTPSLEVHPCLGYQVLKPKILANLMLINRARLKDKSYGLGAPSALPWSLTQEGQLKLQEVFGEVKASNSNEKSRGEMIFEGLISLEQPLKFTNGLEVGVQPRSILTRAGVEWKSITSHILLDLLEFNDKQALLKIDFKKMSRTGEANVFKTESFKRKNQLGLGTWIRLLTYIETTEDHQRRSPLGFSLFGSRSKSKTSQKKELWVKLINMENL